MRRNFSLWYKKLIHNYNEYSMHSLPYLLCYKCIPALLKEVDDGFLFNKFFLFEILYSMMRNFTAFVLHIQKLEFAHFQQVCMCMYVCVCVCVCGLLSIIFTTNGSILRSSSHIVWRDILPYSRPSILLDCTSRKTARLVSLPGNRSSHTVSVIPLSLFLIQMLVYQIPVRPRIRRQWRAEILPGHEEQSAISNTLLFKVFLNKTTEWLFLSLTKKYGWRKRIGCKYFYLKPTHTHWACVCGRLTDSGDSEGNCH